MTTREALDCLRLSLPVDDESIRRQYAKQLRECNLRFNNASSIGKRKEAQEELGKLKEAKLLLEGMARRPTHRPAKSGNRPSQQKSTRPMPVPSSAGQTYWNWSTPQRPMPNSNAPTRASKTDNDFWIIVAAIIFLILIISFAGAADSSRKRQPPRTPTPIRRPVTQAVTPADGLLVVKTHPWSKVHFDSQYLGESPSLTEYRVRPGKHEIILIFYSGQKVMVPIDIVSGKRTVLKYNFYRRRAENEGS